MPFDPIITPKFIDIRHLPSPPMGGKCWLIDRKGLFLLEGGPGTLRTIACTHAGSGSFIAYDGIPGDDGLFPDEYMDPANPMWPQRNGREIYKANPVVMGSWMLDGGFLHGLTIRAAGGLDTVMAIATIVWVPFKTRKA